MVNVLTASLYLCISILGVTVSLLRTSFYHTTRHEAFFDFEAYALMSMKMYFIR